MAARGVRSEGENHQLRRGLSPLDEPHDFDDIPVPTDGSKGAEQAIKFARRNDATLHALYATDMGDADSVAVPSDIAQTRNRLEKRGESFVSEIEDLADDAGVDCVTMVRANTPVEAILEYVDDHDIDLVVMGKRGRSDSDKPLIGSIPCSPPENP
ncbi:universal stress protein [Natrinema sp. 1APR25-10V2]|uniref:universal stress protein n=1 Tax=Natrinema sp. 1APR25-10V2 TaxID=2951081 RepID=UPI002874EA6F|nr:universal stress protein [Natrinema sp. 1APR25-10V2]MDS0477153.1 universal stress protein [Natrinema sp. 1APR25-10V2]